MSIEKDVDFILSHFDQHSLFPRKMMTARSNGQFTVKSKEEIISRCEDSRLSDCRLNAFPEFTDYKGIVMQPPNFVFVDLDLSDFSSLKDPKKALDMALGNTLRKISTSFNKPSQPSQPSQHIHTKSTLPHKSNESEEQNAVKPTVLWTGNGYHVYLPIRAIVLDLEEVFAPVNYPSLFSPVEGGKYMGWSTSEVFLKFCSIFLSSGKADSQHRPKFKTCLVRIPNTLNSKCLSRGLVEDECRVKAVQKWNGYNPPIQFIAKDFRRWLVQQELTERRKVMMTVKKRIPYSKSERHTIPSIEKLLKTPLEDKRKFCLFQILIPYLANVRRLPLASSISRLEIWLDLCNNARKIDFGIYRVKANFKNVKGYMPISKEKLRLEHTDLYNLLHLRGVM